MVLGKRKVLKSSEIDLGGAIFDVATGRVFDRNRRDLELRHQSREVLSALAAEPGEIVTKDMLIDSVWSGRAVAADSIAQCIAEIRRTIGDKNKSVIETVPREGYRLVLVDTEDTLETRLPRWVILPVVTFLVATLVVGSYFLTPSDPPKDGPVVAVLPFEDFSTSQYQGFLSDAVSENIITALARFPQVVVISRRSSHQFRDSELSVAEISEQLGADFILEGSQQLEGSRLRITAQLIEADSEAHIWADEFDVPLTDMLKTNSFISRNIAQAVGATIVDTAEASMLAGDVSALMISNAAQSRIMRSFTRENLRRNIEEQELSLKEYPNSAWGHLGQALSLRIGLRYGWIEGDEEAIRDRMYDLARRAVELDPNNFMAYHALGRVLMFNGDVEGAMRAFQRGVELNPSSMIVANGLVEALLFIGDEEEALQRLDYLDRVNPLKHHIIDWNRAWAYWQLGDCEKALDSFLSAPDMPIAAYRDLTAIHYCLEDKESAEAAMSTYLAENPRMTVSRVREIETGTWKAPGALDRYLVAMEAAGMPG
ncbi:MAG: winged helix-turn-helix domain-containing protein [Pseudomonadota bacterium]